MGVSTRQGWTTRRHPAVQDQYAAAAKNAPHELERSPAADCVDRVDGVEEALNDKQQHRSPPPEFSLHAPQDWPELLAPSQAAQLLHVQAQTVGRWCEEGTIEAVKMGRLWRIPAEAVWPLVPASIRAKWPDGPWKERTDGGQ